MLNGSVSWEVEAVQFGGFHSCGLSWEAVKVDRFRIRSSHLTRNLPKRVLSPFVFEGVVQPIGQSRFAVAEGFCFVQECIMTFLDEVTLGNADLVIIIGNSPYN